MERFGIMFLAAILLLLFKAICADQNEVEALMAFKKTITNDTNGATKDWVSDRNYDVDDPCTWRVVICDNNSVVRINLQSQGLSGQLVADLGNLTNLQYMEFEANKITGQIPLEFGKLANLINFDLSENNLDGPIPNVFDNKLKLLFFRLQQNMLSGSIPTTLTTVPLLQVLDLSSNQLTGEIPAGLADLTNLQSVNLSNNKLSGRVPEFKSINFTIVIDVSNNPDLCGPYTNKQCP